MATKRKLKIEDIKESLEKIIEQLLPGEEIILTRSDEPIARLLPLPANNTPRKPGTGKGLVTIADNFDAPLEDFKDYS